MHGNDAQLAACRDSKRCGVRVQTDISICKSINTRWVRASLPFWRVGDGVGSCSPAPTSHEHRHEPGASFAAHGGFIAAV